MASEWTMAILPILKRHFVIAAMLSPAVGLSACSSGTEARPGAQGSTPQPTLQFAEEAAPEQTTGVVELPFEGRTVRLKTPRTFALKDARQDYDALGYPAVHFEIADPQKEEFRRWTYELIDRQMALLLDGKVVTMPKVSSELPGDGIIDFGAMHKTKEEARELAARLRGQVAKSPSRHSRECAGPCRS